MALHGGECHPCNLVNSLAMQVFTTWMKLFHAVFASGYLMTHDRLPKC
jgi:hypothetical protein